MTKMAAMPIYGKNPLKIFFADNLGTWYVALGVLGLPSLFNNDPRLTLTYSTSRSNLLPSAFKWEFFEKLIF